MSKRFTESFFPAVLAIGTKRVPRIVNFLFPLDVALQCPEARITIGSGSGSDPSFSESGSSSITLRNPILAFWAMAGVSIGLYGAKYCHDKHWDRLWSVAFVFFGLMNVAALPLHCFLDDHLEGTAPDIYPGLWLMDCLCTGISSAAITGACLVRWGGVPSGMVRNWMWLHVLAGVAAVGIFYGLSSFPAATVAATISSNNNEKEISLFHPSILRTYFVELYYFVPIGVAGIAFIMTVAMEEYSEKVPLTKRWDMEDARIKQKVFGIFLGILGGLYSIAGVALDPFFCRAITSKGQFSFLLDAMASPTTVFAACDLAFLGIIVWLDATDTHTQQNIIFTPCVSTTTERNAKKNS